MSFLLCTVGIVAGASYTLTADRLTLAGYLLAMIAPPGLALSLQGSLQQLFSGGMVFAFLAYSWIAGAAITTADWSISW